MAVDAASGSVESFDRNWRDRPERSYVHWTRGEPTNQIQLAFRQHWLVFQEIMSTRWADGPRPGMRCLEVGSGRGSISMYFADAGFECTLLDTSEEVLEIADRIWREHDLHATTIVGDALAMDLDDDSFDVVVSIGLLEHFEQPQAVFAEQHRVLRPGGVLLAYIVPENPDNVQREHAWINDLLAALEGSEHAAASEKEPVYRSDLPPSAYVDAARAVGLREVELVGLYPLPMISPSVSFPFTLNPPRAERVLVEHFQGVLQERQALHGRLGWYCDPEEGQAFLVSATK